MTADQARWLSANRPYRPINITAGTSRFIRTGVLHADGTFEPREGNARPRITPGCFEVGVLEAVK